MMARTSAGRRRRAAAAAALVVATMTNGCRERDDDDTEPDETTFLQEGTDTSAAESDAQLLASSLVSSSPDGTIGLASVSLSGTDLGTRDVGDGARAIYLPRGCLTVTHDASTRTATYVFDHCLGPNGLRAVSGRVTARYTNAPSQLHLELTADDLSVNEASVDWAATADISAAAGSRTMRWKAQVSGTTAGGRVFARTNEHVVTWRLGEACFEHSGVSQGKVRRRDEAEGAGREIRTEITGFRRCRRSCPEAGTITITNVTRNRRVELHYDGSNRATFIGPNGRQASIPLLCRP